MPFDAPPDRSEGNQVPSGPAANGRLVSLAGNPYSSVLTSELETGGCEPFSDWCFGTRRRYCNSIGCNHQTKINADHLPDKTVVRPLGARMVCARCAWLTEHCSPTLTTNSRCCRWLLSITDRAIASAVFATLVKFDDADGDGSPKEIDCLPAKPCRTACYLFDPGRSRKIRRERYSAIMPGRLQG